MSVTLKFGPRNVFDCETAFNEQVIANVTASAESTLVKQGTYSSKFVVDAAFGTGLIGSKAISSMNMSAATQVRFWLRSTVALDANDYQFIMDNTANCASATESINIGAISANTDTLCILTIATPANCTAIISIGLNQVVDKGAMSLYIDKIELVSDSKTFDELHLIGFDNPESEEGFPESDLTRLLDGSWHQTPAVAATRDITIDLGVKQAIADLVWLRDWWYASTIRQVTYGSETIDVVVEGPFPVERKDGFVHAKNVTLRCKEKTARPIAARVTSWV